MISKEINFCKKCLYGDSHPLGLTINSSGLCSGCQIHEEKYNLDWKYRFEKLKKITNEYKSLNAKNYDCIVPISGGAESYWTVHVVKNLLGMNPLLVSYNKYYNTELGIKNLSNLRIQFDCDFLLMNIDPRKIKKITKTTLRMIGSIYWHCIAGQTVFPVQTARDLKIPLIIWGSHQGIEQVGMFSHEHEVEMSRRYRKDHDLMGYEAEDLMTAENTLDEDDIWQFIYPDNLDIDKIGIRGIYLNNYIPWDPKKQDEEMIKRYKFKSSSHKKTFDTYDHVDCFNYMNIHDQLKLYKHGYSKVTDHASREIRHQRLNRDDAEVLVKYYEKNKINYTNYFNEWLNIKKDSLNTLLDLQRNKTFWKLNDWDKKTWDFFGWSKIRKKNKNKKNFYDIKKKLNFISNSTFESKLKKYITIGKGYP
jgi:N-acetyl sugar amidotransferase